MKIKFRALCLIMALAAFASAAWAADPTTFVYSNSTGQLGFLAVGESSVSVNDPITITKFADDAAGTKIKVFTSSDTIAYAGANNLVYLIVESADGSPAVSGDKIATYEKTGLVVGYGLSKDKEVFIGKGGLSFDVAGARGVDSKDIIATAWMKSADSAADHGHDGIFIVAQATKLEGHITGNVNAGSGDPQILSSTVNVTSVAGLVTMDSVPYVVLQAGVYKINGVTSDDIDGGPKFVLNPIFPTTNIYKAIAVDNISTIKKLYILGADNKLYSYAEKTSSSIQPVSTDLSSSETITVATTKVSLDMQAFDGYITVIDDSGLRVYKDDGTAIKLVGKAVEGVVSIAKLATTKATFDGGSGDGDGDDESKTSGAVVDATSLTDAQKDNLKEATGGEAADFVAPDDVTVADGTAPNATVIANVIIAAGTGYENATVAAFKNYTLKNAGYLLVRLLQNVGNVKIFLVPVSSSSSNSAVVAADDATAGVLLDSDYKEITSGSSTYGASTASLAAGTYTLVTATKSSSGDDGDDGDDSGTTTSSSSGGCDAGFGLWAAAALMAVSTISKRR